MGFILRIEFLNAVKMIQFGMLLCSNSSNAFEISAENLVHDLPC